MYSIDYIKDFSDTINRNTLISHFLIKHSFRIKGNEPQYSNQTFILENSRSAGTNIVTHVKNVSGFTMSCKYYNKIVS